MPNLKNTKHPHKINNKTLTGWLAVLAVIIIVWLVGYFTGINEGKNRSANTAPQSNNLATQATADQGPNLPQLPHISEKSATAKLPQLPQLP